MQKKASRWRNDCDISAYQSVLSHVVSMSVKCHPHRIRYEGDIATKHLFPVRRRRVNFMAAPQPDHMTKYRVSDHFWSLTSNFPRRHKRHEWFPPAGGGAVASKESVRFAGPDV